MFIQLFPVSLWSYSTFFPDVIRVCFYWLFTLSFKCGQLTPMPNKYDNKDVAHSMLSCRNKQGDHWSRRLLFQVHVQRNSWAHDNEDEDWKRERVTFLMMPFCGAMAAYPARVCGGGDGMASREHRFSSKVPSIHRIAPRQSKIGDERRFRVT